MTTEKEMVIGDIWSWSDRSNQFSLCEKETRLWVVIGKQPSGRHDLFQVFPEYGRRYSPIFQQHEQIRDITGWKLVLRPK